MKHRRYLDAERLHDLRQDVVRLLARLDALLDDADLIIRVAGEHENGAVKPVAEEVTTAPTETKAYRVGPTVSYADVILRTIGRRRFSLDEAVSVAKALVANPADRLRDSVRQSLDRDRRVDRVNGAGGGIWFAPSEALTETGIGSLPVSRAAQD